MLQPTGWRVAIYLNKPTILNNCFEPPTAFIFGGFLLTKGSKTMKILSQTILCLVGVFVIICPVKGAMTLCQSSGDCVNRCSSLRPYCCPTGETKTVYSCPSGWTLKGTDCIRANASAGSDNKGYMAYVYGSCSATAEKKECFVNSSSSIDSTGKMCMQCIII